MSQPGNHMADSARGNTNTTTPMLLKVTEGESCGHLRNRHGERLFYHISPVVENSPLVVFCSPLLEELVACQPYELCWLRYLAGQNLNVLTFDYSGTGNSWGEHPAPPVAMVEDTLDALQWYRTINPVRKIFLIGIRFGANVALRAAAQTDATAVIGVEPVLDPRKYWVNLLRGNLLTQLSIHGKVVEDRDLLMQRLEAGERINISGYEIDLEFASSVPQFDMAATPQYLREICCLFLRSRGEHEAARGIGFHYTETVAESLCNESRNFDPNRTDLFHAASCFLNRFGNLQGNSRPR